MYKSELRTGTKEIDNHLNTTEFMTRIQTIRKMETGMTGGIDGIDIWLNHMEQWSKSAEVWGKSGLDEFGFIIHQDALQKLMGNEENQQRD